MKSRENLKTQVFLRPAQLPETLMSNSAGTPSLSFPHGSMDPVVLICRAHSPAFCFPDIGYSALHVVLLEEGRLWIKAFSQSKGTFFTRGSGREGHRGVSPLPTAPQARAQAAAVSTEWTSRG